MWRKKNRNQRAIAISASDIVCPFCYSSYSPFDVRFRFNINGVTRHISANPRATGDTLDFLEEQGVYARIVTNDRHMPAECVFIDRKTDIVKMISKIRVCKNEKCNQILSEYAGTYPSDNAVFVIGLKSSGKTVYIASVIEQLKHVLPQHYSCGITPYNSMVDDEYIRNYYNIIFKDKRLPDATTQAAQLTYEVVPMSETVKKTIGITFSDMKGEMSTDADLTSDLTIVLDHSSYFVLTIDLLDPYVADTESVLHNVLSYVTLDPTKKSSRYLAVVITKSDTLINKIPYFAFSEDWINQNGAGSTSIYSELKYDKGAFDAERSDVDRMLRDYLLSDKRFANIVTYAEQIFRPENVNYFAVSALGCAPDPHGNIGDISPIRVEEPILWLLGKSGMI